MTNARPATQVPDTIANRKAGVWVRVQSWTTDGNPWTVATDVFAADTTDEQAAAYAQEQADTYYTCRVTAYRGLRKIADVFEFAAASEFAAAQRNA